MSYITEQVKRRDTRAQSNTLTTTSHREHRGGGERSGRWHQYHRTNFSGYVKDEETRKGNREKERPSMRRERKHDRVRKRDEYILGSKTKQNLWLSLSQLKK